MDKWKNKKGLVVLIIAAMVVGTALGGKAIVSAASRDEAKKAALSVVPEGVDLVEQDEDDGKYEFTFRTGDGTVEYEVEVAKNDGKVKELHTSLRDDRGAETAVLTEQEAIKAVQESWNGAEVTSIRLVKDDGRYLYEARFEADSCYGSAEIHAGTGVIVESDVKLGTPIVVPTTGISSGKQEKETAVYLTSDQIKEQALSRVPEGNIRNVDFDREDGRYIYEVDIYKDGIKYEIIYDAITGDELECDTEKDSWNAAPVMTEPETSAVKENKAAKETTAAKESTEVKETAASKETTAAKETSAPKESKPEVPDVIGKEKASNIALGKAKADGAKIEYIKLERDDGRRVYEGEMRDNLYEYEFEIDAYTGTIIEWDVDELDWDD